MDPISLATAWGASVIGGVVWAVRQEGRINQHTTLFEQNEKLLDERHEELLRRIDRLEANNVKIFDRIERKLDGRA